MSIFQFSVGQIARPDAPDVTITYSSMPTPAFEFMFSNPATSNNYNEAFVEFDPDIDPLGQDQYWRFQGYLIYQLASESVGIFQTFDTTVSRLAAVVDIVDTVTAINLLHNGCSDMAVSLSNTGTQSGATVSMDPFTNLPLVQDQEYCYRVIAFASNPNSYIVNCNVSNYGLYGYTTGNGVLVPGNCVPANQTAELNEFDETGISIYPNPTKGKLFIDSHNEDVKIEVYNSLGQLVLSKKTCSEKEQINLPNSGVFSIQLETNSGVREQRVIRL